MPNFRPYELSVMFYQSLLANPETDPSNSKATLAIVVITIIHRKH